MIISHENEKIKYLMKLKEKKYRDLENKFLIFGDDLLTEAKKSNLIVEIYTSNPLKDGILISPQLIKKINFTQSPFDILAICNKIDNNFKSDKILILEDVQDPANVGGLLRSASAFGFLKVFLTNKCADIYNDKTIRASKGAIFHLDIKVVDIYQKIKDLKKLGYKTYSTLKDGNEKQEKAKKSVLILGNEGKGISNDVKMLCDYEISIKTQNIESLNVLVAGSILMYEWSKIWR